MPWELIAGRGGNSQMESLKKDEVSIVSSTSGRDNKPSVRINVLREVFGPDVKSVLVYVDKEAKRIGFFKVDTTNEEELFKAKALSSYGKKITKKVYIAMKEKTILDLGFEKKTRYRILKSDKDDKMYFYISAKKKVDQEKKESSETKEN